jgi:hypothetical protein
MPKLRNEFPWLVGCVLAAVAFCSYARDYGYSPVPFFSLLFYVAIGIVRAIIRFVNQRRA